MYVCMYVYIATETLMFYSPLTWQCKSYASTAYCTQPWKDVVQMG